MLKNLPNFYKDADKETKLQLWQLAVEKELEELNKRLENHSHLPDAILLKRLTEVENSQKPYKSVGLELLELTEKIAKLEKPKSVLEVAPKVIDKQLTTE